MLYILIQIGLDFFFQEFLKCKKYVIVENVFGVIRFFVHVLERGMVFHDFEELVLFVENMREELGGVLTVALIGV